MPHKYLKSTKCSNPILPLFLAICLSLFNALSLKPLHAKSVKIIDTDMLKKEIIDSKGEIIIVDFWATWCSPCRNQMPILSNIYEKYKSNGLSIVGVALDFDSEKVGKFVTNLRIKYPIYIAEEEVGFQYEINALPTMLIYNKDGNLMDKHVGFISKKELTKIIEDFLHINLALSKTINEAMNN